MDSERIEKILKNKLNSDDDPSDPMFHSFHKLLQKALFTKNGRAKAINRFLKSRVEVDPQLRFPFWQVVLLGQDDIEDLDEIENQLDIVLHSLKEKEDNKQDDYFLKQFNSIREQIEKDLVRRQDEVFGGDGFRFIVIDEELSMGWEGTILEEKGHFAGFLRTALFVFALYIFRTGSLRYVQVTQ